MSHAGDDAIEIRGTPLTRRIWLSPEEMRTAQYAMRMPLLETGKESLSERSGKLTAGPGREKKKGKRKRRNLCKEDEGMFRRVE
jgi:hypothetical protein